MDSLSFIDDISELSILESCIWLLAKLKIDEHIENPYSLPYSNYILTWKESVPLNAIIIGQSPYPNNIFSSISAAMSYSTELCEKLVENKKFKVPIPPTVQVLANDMYINANMDKQDLIDIIQYGWMLVDKGILLINERVFTQEIDPYYYVESCSQLNVIIKLLRETEKYGKRTVDIYGFGVSGQRMASNLCSWYKSNIVRLSKHTCTHPAALTRRYDDFNDPKCHMDTKSFSKSLAKHLSNNVAYVHTMSKKSPASIELELRVQSILSTLRGVGEAFPELHKSQLEFISVLEKVLQMDFEDKKSFKEAISNLLEATRNFEVRTNICSSFLLNVKNNGQNISNFVSKSGPSTTAPNAKAVADHVGQQAKKAETLPSKPIKSSPISIAPSRTKSSYTNVSPPPSVKSIPFESIDSVVSSPSKSITPSKSIITKSTPIKLGGKKITLAPARTVSSPSVISSTATSESNVTVSSPIGRDQDPIMEEDTPTTPVPKSRKFKTNDLTSSFSDMKILDSADVSNENNIGKKLTLHQIRQLSSISAVIDSNKMNSEDDDDCQNDLDTIQHDISSGKVLNSIVDRLVNAIEQDTRNIENFDFSEWAIDNTRSSITYEVCKEIFDF